MSNSLRSRVNKLAYQGHITKKDAEMIREALIKQRERKPKLFKGHEGNYDICPCCDGLLVYYLEHCHMCGQAIDWSEV